MTTITVHKLDTRGEIVVTYEGDLKAQLGGCVLLDARWTRPPLALGYTTFEPGDHFREWYYTDRWYNIFEIRSASGALKGWYCNITEPARLVGTVLACRDLLLDLWVTPDGTMTVLDEDEFAADEWLDAPTRAAALASLAEVQQRVVAREPPFDAIALRRTARQL